MDCHRRPILPGAAALRSAKPAVNPGACVAVIVKLRHLAQVTVMVALPAGIGRAVGADSAPEAPMLGRQPMIHCQAQPPVQ